ncbi:MAG TPA: hypothetical protein VGF55_12995 [Gemmataceae bacterium]|jgi:WD40 repeat protein
MLIFHGPQQQVHCLAFVSAPDGPALAAGYQDRVFVWSLAGGDPVELSVAPVEELAGTHGLEEVSASPDGEWLAGRWYRGTRLWRRHEGRWADARIIPSDFATVTFRDQELILAAGRQLAESGPWGYVIVRLRPGGSPDVNEVLTQPHPDGKVTRGGHDATTALSADGQFLATAAREKAAQLWDARSGEHLGSLPQRGFVEALAWSPDGRTLALNAGVTVRLYDVAARTERVAFKAKYCYVPRLAFSPDGRLLATTDNSTGLHLWDAATGARRATLRAGRERRRPVAFAPDGLTVAAGGANGSVVVWDL